MLRLSPDAFWKMTLRELACAIAAIAGPSQQPPERADFDRLMRRFPDK